MRSKLNRILSLLLVLALSAVIVIPATESVNAASGKSYYLPQKATSYIWTDDGWSKGYYYNFTYNSKGDIIKFKTDVGFTGTTTIKWTYRKNGKPQKAVVRNRNYSDYTTTIKYNKSGKALSLSTFRAGDGEFRDVTWTKKYAYNKKGYVYRIKSDIESLRARYTIKYHSNGLPSTIKRGKVTAKYNKKGLLTEVIYSNAKELYTYTYDSKGRIKSVISYFINKEGEKNEETKTVYTYGKAKTSNKKKYIALIGTTMWDESPIAAATGNPFPEQIDLN